MKDLLLEEHFRWKEFVRNTISKKEKWKLFWAENNWGGEEKEKQCLVKQKHFLLKYVDVYAAWNFKLIWQIVMIKNNLKKYMRSNKMVYMLWKIKYISVLLYSRKGVKVKLDGWINICVYIYNLRMVPKTKKFAKFSSLKIKTL